MPVLAGRLVRTFYSELEGLKILLIRMSRTNKTSPKMVIVFCQTKHDSNMEFPPRKYSTEAHHDTLLSSFFYSVAIYSPNMPSTPIQ